MGMEQWRAIQVTSGPGMPAARVVNRGPARAMEQWRLKLMVFQAMEKLLRVPRCGERGYGNCFQAPFYKILATFTSVHMQCAVKEGLCQEK